MNKRFPPTIQYCQPPKHVVDGWYTIGYINKNIPHTTHKNMYQISTTKEIHNFPKIDDIIKEVIHTCHNKISTTSHMSKTQILQVKITKYLSKTKEYINIKT